MDKSNSSAVDSRQTHAAYVRQVYKTHNIELRYSPQHKEEIRQDSMNIDLITSKPIMPSPGGYTIWIGNTEEMRLAADVPQWPATPKPEPKPADVLDFAARKSEQNSRAFAEHDAYKSENEPDASSYDEDEPEADSEAPRGEADGKRVSIPESERPCYRIFDDWAKVDEQDKKSKPGVWRFAYKKVGKEEIQMWIWGCRAVASLWIARPTTTAPAPIRSKSAPHAPTTG